MPEVERTEHWSFCNSAQPQWEMSRQLKDGAAQPALWEDWARDKKRAQFMEKTLALFVTQIGQASMLTGPKDPVFKDATDAAGKDSISHVQASFVH